MASLIPGFEYDIFISYRQKDNKGDRWVSEFVEVLKTELESTFKEEISVYFDINPHDGLLETHDVDASLKDKLKCLVFIPIISRTYCDPKSFAWEHEFKAFVEQASKDQFGLKIKLPNGNVASRVLPVRIYDLDNADIRLCETVLDGKLRGVDFIYNEPGVNRPLKSDDDEKINLNKTKYRNQINKVGNAIQEIISGLLTEPVELGKEEPLREPLKEIKKEERIEVQEKPAKLAKRKLLLGSILLAVLVIAAILVYPKSFKKTTLERLKSSGERISIAVMPFQNMTNDTIWDIWQDGIKDELISSLSNNPEELKVRQTEAVNGLIKSKGLTNYASISPSLASFFSRKLDANIIVLGSIKQAGLLIRLNAQLIDSKTEEIFKSFQVEAPRKEEMVFPVIDSLSWMIKNFLILSKLRKEAPPDLQRSPSTNSPEAYRYFIYGTSAFYKRDYSAAVTLYSKALAIDSNFLFAASMLSFAYNNQDLYDHAKKWCLRVYEKKEQMSVIQKAHTNWMYASYFETPYEQIKYLKQELEFDNQMPAHFYELGWIFINLYQYDNAISAFKNALEIYEKWDSKPMWVFNYILLGYAYHKTEQYKKERKVYRKAEQDFPDEPLLIYRQAVLKLCEGNSRYAQVLLEKYKSILKEKSTNEAVIATNLAEIYSEAGILDKAEEYHRQSLSLEPENPIMINNLAYFLIDEEQNINKGMELADKALELSPDNYDYLETKGWGLYKQGKYQEALEILQKSWDLRMKNAIYSHIQYLHLEEAKKAVANQNSNEPSAVQDKK
jgi:tetratricopeptide (TPR) repeat protein